MLIILDECPVSKNKYTNFHWSKRKQYKERMSWLIYEAKNFGESNEPKEYKGIPFEKAKITFNIYFKTHRKRDAQNYLGGGVIAILDALVDLGFIVDDNYDVINCPVVAFDIDKDFPRCEILIEAVANENK